MNGGVRSETRGKTSTRMSKNWKTRGYPALFLRAVVVTIGLAGCSKTEEDAFRNSHDSIKIGMTLGEVFGSGLAEYLRIMGVKNAPGATVARKRPASSRCARHVLDVTFTGVFPAPGEFQVRVYCDMNSPSALQLVPARKFENEQALQRALDTEYAPWARNMEFRVESPPRQIGGVYDHYSFVFDHEGRVALLSPILVAPSRR